MTAAESGVRPESASAAEAASVEKHAADAAAAKSEAASEAETKGGSEADPQSEAKGECPICTMFEKGGCKEAFDAFMDCGVQAEKGDVEYTECVRLFDSMRDCMSKNPDVFAPLLGDVDNAVKSTQAGSSTPVSAPDSKSGAV